jgi:hypothetical protein
MRRWLLVVVAALLIAGFACPVASASWPYEQVNIQVEPRPDPRLAKPLGHEPTEADFRRLNGVVGQTPGEVICRLGHPSTIHQAAGGPLWQYEWGRGGARVTFRCGSVVRADYSVTQPVIVNGNVYTVTIGPYTPPQ